jgi:iron(III) transport system permease protein
LAAFGRAYGDAAALDMLGNSVQYAFGSTALAAFIATPLAFIYSRTDVPFKRLIFAGSVLPVVMPAILYAPAWTYLISPRTGLLNWVFQQLFGVTPFNVYSMWGMIWIEGLHLVPIAFLLMANAFRSMDPSLEESAQTCGLGYASILRTITLPLVRPVLIPAILVVLVLALESLDVPLLIGQRGGIYVFTNRIFFLLQQYPIDRGAAGALGLGLLGIAALFSLAGRYRSKGAASYQTITGKGFRPREIPLGRMRPAVAVLVLVYFLGTIVAPLLALLYSSLLPYYRMPSMDMFRAMGFGNYRHLWETPSITSAVTNSILLGIGSATTVAVLTIVAAWFVVRTRTPGRGLVEALAFTPLVIPGLVLGLAVSFIYLRSPLPIYGTIWILLIAYTTRFLPYGMRYSNAAMYQIGTDLEESAQVSGMTWAQSFRRIVVPLAAPGIFAGWIYIFIVSLRELGASILLFGPATTVLPVLIYSQFTNGDLTILAATGVSMSVFLVVIVTFAQKLASRAGVAIF